MYSAASPTVTNSVAATFGTSNIELLFARHDDLEEVKAVSA
jgi:hypothetical protein